jgi:hypothetical protein
MIGGGVLGMLSLEFVLDGPGVRGYCWEEWLNMDESRAERLIRGGDGEIRPMTL